MHTESLSSNKANSRLDQLFVTHLTFFGIYHDDISMDFGIFIIVRYMQTHTSQGYCKTITIEDVKCLCVVLHFIDAITLPGQQCQ